MRVVCDRRDQDLFFLSHGMLSGLRQFWVGLHLRRCPSCRKRVSSFSETSRQLRLAFGGSPVVLTPSRPFTRLGVAGLLALLLAAVAFASFAVLRPEEPPAPIGTRKFDANCGPHKLSKAESMRPQKHIPKR